MNRSLFREAILATFAVTFVSALMFLYTFPMLFDGKSGLLLLAYAGLFIVALVRQSLVTWGTLCAFGLLSLLLYNYINEFAEVKFLGEVPINAYLIGLTLFVSAVFSLFLYRVRDCIILFSFSLGIGCGILLAFLQFLLRTDISIFVKNPVSLLLLSGIFGVIPGAVIGLIGGTVYKNYSSRVEPENFNLTVIKKAAVMPVIACGALYGTVYPELFDLEYDGLYGTKKIRATAEGVQARLVKIYDLHKGKEVDLKVKVNDLLAGQSWDTFCLVGGHGSFNNLKLNVKFRDKRVANKWGVWGYNEEHENELIIVRSGEIIPVPLPMVLDGRNYQGCHKNTETFEMKLRGYKNPSLHFVHSE